MAKRNGRSDTHRHLVTAGNFGFVANATPVYAVRKVGKSFVKDFNVAPGQLVMWSGDINCITPPNAIAPANLTLSQLSSLNIGVGYSENNDGITTAIRLLTPGELQGCTIDGLDVAEPQCATPWLKALYPECVSCDTITARVRVFDNQSLSFSDNPLKAYQEYVESFTPQCKSCDDCDRTVTCDEVVCGLVDALNGDTDLSINGSPYPHYIDADLPRPYTAFKLHPTWKSYCISPVVGEGCTQCNTIDALTTYTINDVDYNFGTGVLNPSDNLQTLVAQLDRAVDIINEKFEATIGRHGGKAFISRGKGACCPLQLFVSTCDPTFEIAGLVECPDAIEQFPDFITSGTCKQCGSGTATETPNCGIGFFVKPDLEDCNSYDVPRPSRFDSRWIEVDFISGSGNDNVPLYSKKATLLEGQIASGYGNQVKYLEYASNIDAIGFEGFQYEIGNATSGWQGLPEKRSRARKSMTADCAKSYCGYQLDAHATTPRGPVNNFVDIWLEGTIWVPKTDTTTKTAMNALYAKIVTLVPTTCDTLTGASCA
jgi:hypothetical protein